MSLVVEVIQLAMIVMIGVSLLNTSSLIERSKKYESSHDGLAQNILGLDRVMETIQARLTHILNRLDDLENRVSVIDPNGGDE